MAKNETVENPITRRIGKIGKIENPKPLRNLQILLSL